MVNEDISPKDTLKELVREQAKKRGITFAKIGEALGMKPAYFSDLMNGRKKRSVEFLNSLADYLMLPRVDIYQAAGLLDLDEDDLRANRVKEWYRKDAYFRQALDQWAKMDDEQRDQMFLWIFYKTLQETNRLQSPPINIDWEKAISTGEIKPDAFQKLSKKQQRAVSGLLQLILEAVMSNEDDENSKSPDNLSDQSTGK